MHALSPVISVDLLQCAFTYCNFICAEDLAPAFIPRLAIGVCEEMAIKCLVGRVLQKPPFPLEFLNMRTLHPRV